MFVENTFDSLYRPYRLPRTEMCQFFAHTQRELGALGVLCSPQVCGKLIYHAPGANCSQTVWFACGLQVCTGLNARPIFNPNAISAPINCSGCLSSLQNAIFTHDFPFRVCIHHGEAILAVVPSDR